MCRQLAAVWKNYGWVLIGVKFLLFTWAVSFPVIRLSYFLSGISGNFSTSWTYFFFFSYILIKIKNSENLR